jgi:ribonuclease HI
VNPRTQTITHVEIKSQAEIHTFNRAELAAIAMALELCNESPQIQIYTDSVFSINTLRNYAIDPLNYTHHQHKKTTTPRQQTHQNYLKKKAFQPISGKLNPTVALPTTIKYTPVPAA